VVVLSGDCGFGQAVAYLVLVAWFLLLSPIQHRSAQAQADLSVIRARYALVRARTALVCAARGLTKSFRERIRGRNPKGFRRATSETLSPHLLQNCRRTRRHLPQRADVRRYRRPRSGGGDESASVQKTTFSDDR
jgi:hypothetical protein